MARAVKSWQNWSFKLVFLMANSTASSKHKKDCGESSAIKPISSIRLNSSSAYDIEFAYHRQLQVHTATALMGQFYNGDLSHHSAAAALAMRGSNGGIGMTTPSGIPISLKVTMTRSSNLIEINWIPLKDQELLRHPEWDYGVRWTNEVTTTPTWVGLIKKAIWHCHATFLHGPQE